MLNNIGIVPSFGSYSVNAGRIIGVALGTEETTLKSLRPVGVFQQPNVLASFLTTGLAACGIIIATKSPSSAPPHKIPRLTLSAALQGTTASNAVFYGDKAIDRSPCGTGTSARMAQWFAKGKLKVGDTFIHESIIGSVFKGRVEAAVQVGDFSGMIPSIEGDARIIGYNQLILDPEDPYVEGFQVI